MFVVLFGVSMVTFTDRAKAQDVPVAIPALKVGQKILVATDNSARAIEGNVVEHGADALTLRVKDEVRSIPLGVIESIQTPDDPVWDGAAIGAVGLAAWCAYVCGQGLDRASDWPKAVLAAAGWGAAIGAAIDARHGHRTDLYRRPSVAVLVIPSSNARVSLGMRIAF
jgi:hypothetical protein